MDPISHVAWGIVSANVLPGPMDMLPRITIAAVASVAPDLDFVTKYLRNIYFLKYHHTVTHSFVGVAAIGLIIAALGCLVFPAVGFWEAYLVALVSGSTHTLLDLLMHGTGAMALWPFSKRMITSSLLLGLNPKTVHARCHEKSLRVCFLCQLFSACMTPLMHIGFVAAVVSTLVTPMRETLALSGLILGVLYLLFCHIQKVRARRVAEREHPNAKKTLAFPASFSPLEWLVICEMADGFRLLWQNSLQKTPGHNRTLPPAQNSAAIEQSKQTQTVREFLAACVIPWVFEAKGDGMIRVQWQDLSYALSESMDLYAARITMREDLGIVDHDFRERWPDQWRPD